MQQQHTLHNVPRAPAASDISRCGGAPLGVGADLWPTIYNPLTGARQPMLHVLSVDPRALDLDVPASVGALSLFASSFEMPLYPEDPTCDYEVVQVPRSALARGVLPTPELPEPPLEGGVLEFRPAAARVEGLTFAGGAPRYIQSRDDGSADFVLQFDERFLPLNLGDSGALYMFTSWAFWECH